MDKTYQEISNQSKSWQQTLDIVAQSWSDTGLTFDSPGTHALFIGCGTSLYLAQSAARLFQEVTGIISVASPASEVMLTSEAVVPANMPVIAFAISRSGTTSEILMAVDYLHRTYSNVKTVGVTCHSEKTLAKLAHAAICLDHAREESVVMTQSFTNMLLALQWIAAHTAKRTDLMTELAQLPQALETGMDSMMEFATTIGRDAGLNQFIYLGLGSYNGLAEEGTLKLKEMTQTPCEAYNPLEFRHGPISIVEQGTATVFLVSQVHASYIRGVIDDVKKLNARVFVLTPAAFVDDFAGHAVLPLADGFSDWARAVLYMPVLQFLAHARAVELGLNPDRPRNLSQVVILSKSE